MHQRSKALQCVVQTGRKHQIRRHFDMIGFPVIGNPVYGDGNKNTEGMELTAIALEFKCPFSGLDKIFNLTRKGRNHHTKISDRQFWELPETRTSVPDGADPARSGRMGRHLTLDA